MKYHINWLLEQMDKEERVKFLFFWGHTPSKDGSVNKSVFSQWWDGHPFEVDGLTYKTAEHWMMAGKAKLFKDDEILEKIIACESPAEAKKFGREVRNFESKEWNDHKYEIVKQGNIHKFGQHEDLKKFIVSTGNRVLVEASPRDRIWGIGMGQNNENAVQPNNWRGQNLLGFALMEAREELEE